MLDVTILGKELVASLTIFETLVGKVRLVFAASSVAGIRILLSAIRHSLCRESYRVYSNNACIQRPAFTVPAAGTSIAPSYRLPTRATSIATMSIFRIVIIAFITRLAAARSGSCVAASSARGVICHEKPQRSLHQPHMLS